MHILLHFTLIIANQIVTQLKRYSCLLSSVTLCQIIITHARQLFLKWHSIGNINQQSMYLIFMLMGYKSKQILQNLAINFVGKKDSNLIQNLIHQIISTKCRYI